jgi:pentatricopeptide repeat protein
VLTPAIEKAWNDPEPLRAQIVQALRDDFPAQVAAAAERLVEIEHESEDALVIAAVTRLALEDAAGADAILQRALAKHGPSGVVLTNVAKVQERRGAKADARKTLRRALELDPNQDNGLGWWAADAHKAGGDAEYVAALESIAVLPGAWRPQLWLGRVRLKMGDRAGALALYDEVLSRAGDSSDALMMVTGDLGNAGALEELVRLGAPRYKPDVHGPHAGMNLAQAFKQLGRIDEAREVVRRMQAMGWAPLAATLAALDADIMNAAAPQPAGETPPEVGVVAFDTPDLDALPVRAGLVVARGRRRRARDRAARLRERDAGRRGGHAEVR